jgi:tripartite-type tricarboxylate transporter receptor subunit TctC
MLWVGIVMVVLFSAPLGMSLAAEKNFPTKPIQVIIPFQPGETDNLLRPFLERMPEYLGQPVNIVYKPGAAGSLGAGFVASSRPDGYTLLGSSSSSVVILPLTNKDLPYNYKSFAPITGMADCPQVIAVLSSSPWKTLPELIAAAKQSPGQSSFSCSGTYSFIHLMISALSNLAGMKLNFIPSQGAGPAMTSLLGGHVQLAGVGMAPALPHIKTGTIRPLAVYDPKRIEALPEVPTVSELGYSLSSQSIFGILAPKDTPKEIVEILYSAAKKVVENHKPALTDRLEKLGSQIGFISLDEYRTYFQAQHEYFGKVLEDLKK